MDVVRKLKFTLLTNSKELYKKSHRTHFVLRNVLLHHTALCDIYRVSPIHLETQQGDGTCIIITLKSLPDKIFPSKHDGTHKRIRQIKTGLNMFTIILTYWPKFLVFSQNIKKYINFFFK